MQILEIISNKVKKRDIHIQSAIKMTGWDVILRIIQSCYCKVMAADAFLIIYARNGELSHLTILRWIKEPALNETALDKYLIVITVHPDIF